MAADARLGIGKDGKLPWHLSKDLAYFKRVTTEVRDPSKRNAVLMGRKTWESIPAKYRPLPGRLNIVISEKGVVVPEGVIHTSDFDTAIYSAAIEDNIESVFVIGGGQIFRTALKHSACRLLYLTDIHADFNCDVFLPDFREDFVPYSNQGTVERENGIEYEFKVFIRYDMLHGAESRPAGAGANEG
nr:Dihydrofolate reductase [uncultured bacterium]